MSALFPTPSADFDHPIDILDGCHERIMRNCATIERLAVHIGIHGRDADARQAAAGVLRYFDTAGKHHHRDEEDDLFPALESSRRPASEMRSPRCWRRCAPTTARSTCSGARMRARLAEIIEGRDAPLTEALAREFTAAYEAHIARETDELLPLARRMLDAPATRSLGDSMAGRRGVDRERYVARPYLRG